MTMILVKPTQSVKYHNIALQREHQHQAREEQVNQPINRPINQTIKRSIKQSNNQAINQAINGSISHSNNGVLRNTSSPSGREKFTSQTHLTGRLL
jgi:hypothetical protein